MVPNMVSWFKTEFQLQEVSFSLVAHFARETLFEKCEHGDCLSEEKWQRKLFSLCLQSYIFSSFVWIRELLLQEDVMAVYL